MIFKNIISAILYIALFACTQLILLASSLTLLLLLIDTETAWANRNDEYFTVAFITALASYSILLMIFYSIAVRTIHTVWQGNEKYIRTSRWFFYVSFLLIFSLVSISKLPAKISTTMLLIIEFCSILEIIGSKLLKPNGFSEAELLDTTEIE